MAIQYARPVGDYNTATSSWTPTPFYTELDDPGDPGDNNVVTSDSVSNGETTTPIKLELTNTGMTDPLTSTGHILRWRGNVTVNRNADFQISLYQGQPSPGFGSEIQTWTTTDPGATETTYTHTLTGGEADLITDYNNLYILASMTRTSTGPAISMVLEYVEFQFGDAEGGGFPHWDHHYKMLRGQS